MRNLLPQILRRRLTRRQCVAYVGAGFSRACGMPDWSSLLVDLLKFARETRPPGDGDDDVLTACDRAVHRAEYAMAASLLRRALSEADLNEIINQKFGNHVLSQASSKQRSSMETRLEHLARAPWAGIVTTNFDALVERALGHWCDREVTSVTGDDPRLGHVLSAPYNTGLFFVKVHGNLAGGKIVLSTEEYDRTYLGSPRVTSFPSALFLRYFVVFIGCSLEDEVVRIRRRLSIEFDGLIPPAYALLPGSERNRTRATWLRDVAKVESIFYPDGEHEHVEGYLAELADCGDAVTRSTSVGRASSTPRERGLTQLELSRLPIEARLERIGALNRELIKGIADAEGHAMRHVDLVNLTSVKSPGESRLLEITPEERVYRVLYLATIGLLAERPQDNERGIMYVVPDDVVTCLKIATASGGLNE